MHPLNKTKTKLSSKFSGHGKIGAHKDAVLDGALALALPTKGKK